MDSTIGYSGQILHEWCHIQKCCCQHCVDNYDKLAVKSLKLSSMSANQYREIRHLLWHSLSVEEEDMQCWSSDYSLVVSIICRWADKIWTPLWSFIKSSLSKTHWYSEHRSKAFGCQLPQHVLYMWKCSEANIESNPSCYSCHPVKHFQYCVHKINKSEHVMW